MLNGLDVPVLRGVIKGADELRQKALPCSSFALSTESACALDQLTFLGQPDNYWPQKGSCPAAPQTLTVPM